MMQGHISDALPLLAPGASQMEHIGSEYDRLRFMGNYAMCLTMAGRCKEAMALHDHALAYATASSNSSGLAVALAMRAFSERAMGDPAVLGTIEVAREHTLRSNERLLYYLLARYHGWVEGLAGRMDAAREHWEEARAVAEELGGKSPYDDLFLAGEAQVALVNGDVETALATVAEAVPRLRDDGLELGHGLAEQVWGQALLETGSPDAEVHFEAARKIFERTGQRLAAARLDLELARLARKQGRLDRAEQLRGSALGVYTEAGVPELIAVLDSSLSGV
jgi:tetratricopeptide (TPR) repeat protein